MYDGAEQVSGDVCEVNFDLDAADHGQRKIQTCAPCWVCSHLEPLYPTTNCSLGTRRSAAWCSLNHTVCICIATSNFVVAVKEEIEESCNEQQQEQTVPGKQSKRQSLGHLKIEGKWSVVKIIRVNAEIIKQEVEDMLLQNGMVMRIDQEPTDLVPGQLE